MTGRWTLGPLQAESEELMHLDVLRFLAATAIVVYHFRLQLDTGPASPPVAALEALSLCVDLFFFISGFVITRFYGSIGDAARYRGFLKKRFARLYPLHLATALVFIAIGAAYSLGVIKLRLADQFDFHCLPANLLLLHSAGLCDGLSFNPASWSISAEMILYASLPLLLLLRRGGARLTIAVAGAILALLTFKAGYGSPRPWYSWTYDYGFVRALPSFLLGMGCYDARKTIALLPRPALLLWGGVAAFIILLFADAPAPLLLATLYAIGLAGVAADQQGGASRTVRRLAPLGLLTYSLYMLHPVVDIAGISFLGKKALKLSGNPLNLWILACFMATYALSWISLQLFEAPARAWLARDRKAYRTAPAAMPAGDQHGPL